MVQSKQKKRQLIAYSHPDSDISEQFRSIHTNIKFSLKDQERRILLFTSPCTGEGKSTTVANLAVSIAQQRKKVLLIDANFRTPVIHTIFKIENSTGISDVFTDKISFENAIQRTEMGHLDILTSGLSQVFPVEFLGSNKMGELLNKALKMYDVVLIDSYSLMDAAETKLLATQCDGVILVIKSGKTHFEKVAEAIRELDFAQAALLGVILNEC